ncbi:thiocillin family RiPP [Amycolatopsis keratiniphila]|uniref:Thiocillin family RiPP n=1 Tax=Amycolatopsis keratiniphila subsp. keratiniphila TaxID=227715 RepID=A0A1W2LXL3_9PSEU|nr:thiocillin family RiPP [Amycolatopsis keratiniphila]OLZ47265.1 hypothetical protein BS330_34945 [Amycolatopsis keratiniphila subsp. nogabecina]ONF71372.1 hypothetical protein AVR91_0211840 [Amycolatopsis keratiniphila subsp. keratiniphila]SDU38594.1 hypothetical protein SAMN04489733_3632 [Amycolatopsis keratiniphila]
MEITTTEHDLPLDLWAEESGANIAAEGCTIGCAGSAGSAGTFGCPVGTFSSGGSSSTAGTGC